MSLFDKIKEPIFLKEESTLTEQLGVLEDILKNAPPETSKKLEQEIRNVRSGILGEQQIAFELKNSHIPMYVLHDLYFEYEGLTAQIDYLVLTRRRNFVIECKNLYGNVEITAQGDFIRNISYGNKFFKERIYSPITQNERHLGLIKSIRSAERQNFLTKAFFEKNFSENYRSVVVLANPKTIRNDKYAKKEIKDQVIPVDQLVAHIRKVNSEASAEDCYEKNMTDLAHFFLSINKPQPDYTKKYQQLLTEEEPDSLPSDSQLDSLSSELKENEIACPDCKAPDSQKPVLCPRCGMPMVLRTAAKGGNAGKPFYGCSNFPKCRAIVSETLN